MHLLFLLLACTPEAETDAPAKGGPHHDAPTDGPGTEEWGDVDVSCDVDADCLSNESCDAGTCQVERCAGSLAETSAPIGDSLVFARDTELAVADADAYDGGHWIDAYSDAVSYEHSWSADDGAVVDLAGGRFRATDAEELATISLGSRSARLTSDGETLALGLVPVAIAAGDLDGDGLDEAIAVSAEGTLAVCDADTGSCDSHDTGTNNVIDLAAGDLDGDGLDEPILLYGAGKLLALNLDAAWTGQLDDSWASSGANSDLLALSAADTDGDRVDTLVSLADGGCLDWCDDSLLLYALSDGKLTVEAEHPIDGEEESIDLDAADLGADGADEIVVLAEDAEAVVMDGSGRQLRHRTLSLTSSPARIAMVDHDADSPRATLMGAPEPVIGSVVPLMVMLLPPYEAEHSPRGSWAGFGDSTTTASGYSDTVSLGLHVDVGVGADMWGVFGASMSTTVSWALSRTHTEQTTLQQGGRYLLTADPALYGPQHGGVVLSWGCFDAYTYTISDPDHRLGDHTDGEAMVMTVPTGGGTSLWSSARYNAMAEAVGDLPVIDVPYTVGDPSSYPEAPEDLLGDPLADARLVFPSPRTHTASDIAEVSWESSVSDSETTTSTLQTNIGASASVTAGGVTVGGGASYGWGEGYSLTVGSSSVFSGAIPPLPDDPSTAADEYAALAYRVTPWVYVQDYTDADGNDSAFYVMTYSVR